MGKAERKKGQMYRREARNVYKQYSYQLSERLGIFNQALKPKPRWIPNFIWRSIAGMIIDISKLENLLNPQVPKSIELKRCPICQKWNCQEHT